MYFPARRGRCRGIRSGGHVFPKPRSWRCGPFLPRERAAGESRHETVGRICPPQTLRRAQEIGIRTLGAWVSHAGSGSTSFSQSTSVRKDRLARSRTANHPNCSRARGAHQRLFERSGRSLHVATPCNGKGWCQGNRRCDDPNKQCYHPLRTFACPSNPLNWFPFPETVTQQGS